MLSIIWDKGIGEVTLHDTNLLLVWAVYYHRMQSDGGFIYSTHADAQTFTALGACFAKDKDNIYFVSASSGMGTMDVDYESFKTCHRCGCAAVDKNGLYYFDERVTLDDDRLSDDMKSAFHYLQAR